MKFLIFNKCEEKVVALINLEIFQNKRSSLLGFILGG